MASEKQAFFQQLEHLAQQIARMTPDAIDDGDALFTELREIFQQLLQPENPYHLNQEEVQSLQKMSVDTETKLRGLIEDVTAQADALQQKGVAAASYLKHS